MLPLQADTLRSIPTSSHYGVSKKGPQLGRENFPLESVCLESIFGHLEMKCGLRSNEQCNARGSLVLPTPLFTPNIGKTYYPHSQVYSPDQPSAQPSFISLDKDLAVGHITKLLQLFFLPLYYEKSKI